MNSRELIKAVMRREPVERIPTMPQICHDLPIRILAYEQNLDWIDGYQQCAEKPSLSHDYVIDLALRIKCDGVRLFVPGDLRTVVRTNGGLIVIDQETKKRIGKIDVHGGGGFVPDHHPAPVETVKDAKIRLDKKVCAFTDEKLELLKVNRARVPDLFVASSPNGITMNTYNELRGREQAMLDFYERPDFVSAVLDMQAEMAICQAEKLLKTGIDAFYIGDPSASASLISPKHFEQFCFPAYRKFCRHFENTDILIYIHICGNSKPILEMMADTGVDAIEPLDPLGGVSVSDAKARVGNRVALMGGVNTLTLDSGTSDEVIAESVVKCREGGPDGYVLAAGDMVPPGTPLKNLQAMVDVALEGLWK
jgi:hypothetical protein